MFRPPNPLTFEQPPATPISADNIWVLWNLHKAFAMEKPYEHQLYGPVNSLLVAIFVLRRLFSINPQHIHRAVMEVTDIRGHLSNVSIGSTGAFHMTRTVKQNEPQPQDKQYPDFTVVKVVPTGPREVFLICILEIKCQDDSRSTLVAYEQMTKYMERMGELPNRDEVFYGFLLSANTMTYEKWTVRKDTGDVSRVDGNIPIFGGRAPLVQALGELARRYWTSLP